MPRRSACDALRFSTLSFRSSSAGQECTGCDQCSRSGDVFLPVAILPSNNCGETLLPADSGDGQSRGGKRDVVPCNRPWWPLLRGRRSFSFPRRDPSEGRRVRPHGVRLSDGWNGVDPRLSEVRPSMRSAGVFHVKHPQGIVVPIGAGSVNATLAQNHPMNDGLRLAAVSRLGDNLSVSTTQG